MATLTLAAEYPVIAFAVVILSLFAAALVKDWWRSLP